MDLDWTTTSGRATSASGGSKEAALSADTTIDLLVGATKPGFSMWKAQILRKIYHITPKMENYALSDY